MTSTARLDPARHLIHLAPAKQTPDCRKHKAGRVK